jgi:hypothetical protein
MAHNTTPAQVAVLAHQLADALRIAVPQLTTTARTKAVEALAAWDARPQNPRCSHCGEHRYDVIGVDYWKGDKCPCQEKT